MFSSNIENTIITFEQSVFNIIKLLMENPVVINLKELIDVIMVNWESVEVS